MMKRMTLILKLFLQLQLQTINMQKLINKFKNSSYRYILLVIVNLYIGVTFLTNPYEKWLIQSIGLYFILESISSFIDLIQKIRNKNNKNNNHVFLGGTCNNSLWRDTLISKLKCSYFNPVVSNWNESAYQEELKQRESCNYCLYVITPKMTYVYSIAEIIDDSNKRSEKTLFCILNGGEDGNFTEDQLKSLLAVQTMVKNNGGKVFNNIDEIAEFLNNSYVQSL